MMLVPGGNILNAALRVIQPQAPRLKRWTGRTQNNRGEFVPTYAPPVAVVGSFQPVDRKLYQQLGLDLSKSYATLFTATTIRTLDRDAAGDQVVYGGRLWEAQSQVNWQTQDGWGEYAFVDIGPST
jgi:hypothetical protein